MLDTIDVTQRATLVRLPEDDLCALRQLVHATQVSQSSYLREAIGDLLSRNRSLADLHERISEARAAYEAALSDGTTEARHLIQEAGERLPLEDTQTTPEVDEYIDALEHILNLFMQRGEITPAVLKKVTIS